MALYTEYANKVNEAQNGLRAKLLDHMVANHLTITTLRKKCSVSWTTLHKFLKLEKPIDMYTMKKISTYLEESE